MRTIYELDAVNVWTGNSRKITDKEGRPENWIHSESEPPVAEFVQWDGGAWVVLDEYPEPEPTPEELKLQGVEINGVMCSATRDDQNGLSAVALGVTIARLNGQTFPDTRFQFENGNSLIITDDNFDAIYGQWVPFRQSFFAPE